MSGTIDTTRVGTQAHRSTASRASESLVVLYRCLPVRVVDSNGLPTTDGWRRSNLWPIRENEVSSRSRVVVTALQSSRRTSTSILRPSSIVLTIFGIGVSAEQINTEPATR